MADHLLDRLETIAEAHEQGIDFFDDVLAKRRKRVKELIVFNQESLDKIDEKRRKGDRRDLHWPTSAWNV